MRVWEVLILVLILSLNVLERVKPRVNPKNTPRCSPKVLYKMLEIQPKIILKKNLQNKLICNSFSLISWRPKSHAALLSDPQSPARGKHPAA
jgi:hypothetical protein